MLRAEAETKEPGRDSAEKWETPINFMALIRQVSWISNPCKLGVK
jgi:hypothetical protein